MNQELPALTLFLKPHLHDFFRLYCLILINVVLDGMICSSVARKHLGSMIMHSMIIASITGTILNNFPLSSV